MNRRIGMISSMGTFVFSVLFVTLLILNRYYLYQIALLGMVFCFVPMICTFNTLYNNRSRTAGLISMAFATIALCIISIVSITQFTTVRIRTEEIVLKGHEALLKQVLAQSESGSLFACYMLLGFLFLSLSALFLSFTIQKKGDFLKVMSNLLLIHIVYIVFIIILIPLMVDNSLLMLVYIMWCVLFAPVTLMSFFYFKNSYGKRQ